MAKKKKYNFEQVVINKDGVVSPYEGSRQQSLDNSYQAMQSVKQSRISDSPIHPRTTQTTKVEPTVKTVEPTVTTQPTINSDGYTATNKKYGDYKYQDYANKKDYKVYKKDNKSYYYDEANKKFVDMDEATMTTPEQDKKEYEEAVKNGFKDRKEHVNGKQVAPVKIANLVKLDTSNAPLEKKKEQAKKLIEEEQKVGKAIVGKTANKEPTILDRINLYTSGAKSGVASGLTGIAEAPLQETQNALQKGEKIKTKQDMAAQLSKALGYIVSPTAAKTIEDIYDMFNPKKEDKKKNIVEKGMDGLNNYIDRTGTTKGLKEALTAYGATNPNLDDKVADIRKAVRKPSTKIEEAIERELSSKNYNGADKTATDVTRTVGNMAPSIVATAVTKDPNLGLATMGASVKGQATTEAENRGKKLEDAIKIGNTKALGEVATEMLTGGLNIFGKGVADDIAEKAINKYIKNNALNFGTKKLVGTAGEIGEELLSDQINNLIDRSTIDPNQKYTLDDAKNTAFQTLLSTLALNGLTGGYSPSAYRQNAAEINNNNSSNSIKKDEIYRKSNVAKQVISEKIQDAVENGDITPEQGIQELNAVDETIKNTINQEKLIPINEEQNDIQTTNEVQNNDIASQADNFNLGKNTTTKSSVDNYMDEYKQNQKEKAIQEKIDNLNKQVEKLQKNKTNYTGNSNLSFSEQIDNWKVGKIKPNEHIVVFKETPKIYQDLGLENHPMTLVPRKLERIYNEFGKQKGKYHGLGEMIKQLPEALENPLNIVESKDGTIVAITDMADKKGNIVIASIKIDGNGRIEIDNVSKNVPSNVLTSSYGRENYDYQLKPHNGDYTGWMEEKRKNNQILYDIDEGIKKQRINGQWLSLPNSNNSFVSNNISEKQKNVKSDISTNSNMQEKQKNVSNKSTDTKKVEKTDKKSVKDKNNSDILYETKEPNDVLVIKNDIKNKPLDSKTTSDEINYVLNGDKGESKFFKNITEDSKFIDKENRSKLSKEDNIKFYDKVTNKESLQEAQERLDNMGENAIVDFFSDKKQVDSVDIATGWILLKRFQDIGDYDSMTQVAKKMRTMGTKAGQAIQTFNIMSRLTPEGMVKYAQSELMEAYDKYSENKSQKWVDENREDFGLTPEETQFIVDTMKKVETMEDGYPKKVELAKIQKMLQDKLPPEKGQGVKSWMRISMLFNPKTQIRNIVGNAAITPVNAVADVFGSATDKILAKRTGVRTTGMANVGAYLKGSKQGAYEATNDFKLGINTKDVNQNRFEVGQGKAFNEKMKGVKSIFNPLSKAGNKVDHILNYALDVGDRVFSQGAFNQSLQNQMILNNTNEITQDMIDIAEQEALSRTWNDDNNYTKFVLDIRRGLNKIGPKSYGLGDVLIPFAKTPANLTKAIVDYSPVGVASSIIEYHNKIKNNLEKGTLTPQMQHEFAQRVGKATAGTMLYILGYALAKSKITSGANDDDKEVADFMRNTLGIQPYSIKIGDKSFTYDWMQPVAAPFAIMADLEKNSDKEQNLHDAISSVADTGFNLLMEQSFMQSINDVLSGYGSKFEKIEDQVYGLPARSVPTFLKQVNDMIDSKTRMSYDKNSKGQTAINQVKTKTPGLSQELPVKRDTLGREVEKYGGDNSIFNVFLNPANVSKGKVSQSAKEIYSVYEATKDKRIMPREPASQLGLTNKQTSDFLKISGGIIEDNVKELKKDDMYNVMSDGDKADVIRGIVDYAYNKAKSKILKTEISRNWKTADKKISQGMPVYDYYVQKISK